jgi:hypothetical protein
MIVPGSAFIFGDTCADSWCDPYWDNVVLAMHMDGTNGSTTFTDLKGHTVTPNSGAVITTTYSKYGGASYDGTVAKVTISSPTVLDSTDWTVEFFAYYPSLSSSIYLEKYGTEITIVHCGKLLLAKSSRNNLDTAFHTTSVVDFNEFPHIAIVKAGTTITVYAKGTSIGAATSANYSFTIGEVCGDGGTSFGTTGLYLDDLRITKGVARYASNFTPPCRAFPNSAC